MITLNLVPGTSSTMPSNTGSERFDESPVPNPNPVRTTRVPLARTVNSLSAVNSNVVSAVESKEEDININEKSSKKSVITVPKVISIQEMRARKLAKALKIQSEGAKTKSWKQLQKEQEALRQAKKVKKKNDQAKFIRTSFSKHRRMIPHPNVVFRVQNKEDSVEKRRKENKSSGIKERNLICGQTDPLFKDAVNGAEQLRRYLQDKDSEAVACRRAHLPRYLWNTRFIVTKTCSRPQFRPIILTQYEKDKFSNGAEQSAATYAVTLDAETERVTEKKERSPPLDVQEDESDRKESDLDFDTEYEDEQFVGVAVETEEIANPLVQIEVENHAVQIEVENHADTRVRNKRSLSAESNLTHDANSGSRADIAKLDFQVIIDTKKIMSADSDSEKEIPKYSQALEKYINAVEIGVDSSKYLEGKKKSAKNSKFRLRHSTNTDIFTANLTSVLPTINVFDIKNDSVSVPSQALAQLQETKKIQDWQQFSVKVAVEQKNGRRITLPVLQNGKAETTDWGIELRSKGSNAARSRWGSAIIYLPAKAEEQFILEPSKYLDVYKREGAKMSIRK